MEPSNWQSQLSTVRDRNEYAFNNSLFSDIEFSVEDSNGVKVTIPANKYVLAISSPVFEAMFYGQLAETKPTIDLPDCSEEGLREMLRFVYSDEVKLTRSNVLEVLFLADKYIIPSLKEKCINCIRPEDVLSVFYEVKNLTGGEKLIDQLWNIIDSELYRTVSSTFLIVSREMLHQILVRDTLNIKEVDLFRAVDRWAEERIKEKGLENNGEAKRSILGEEIIRLIRFPLMTGKEFSEVVLPAAILEKNELTELIQIFHDVSPTTNLFITRERCFGELVSTLRFLTVRPPDKWNYKGKKDALSFSTNKAVYLCGVEMFGSYESEYSGELTIYKDEESISQNTVTGRKVAGMQSGTCYYNNFFGFTVRLDQPVRIHPKVVYTLEAQITGPPSYYGESGERSVTFGNNITITYEYSMKSDNGTTPKEGQFPRLIFRKI